MKQNYVKCQCTAECKHEHDDVIHIIINNLVTLATFFLETSYTWEQFFFTSVNSTVRYSCMYLDVMDAFCSHWRENKTKQNKI